MFDLSWDKPEPLVTRRYRREVDERVLADGTVLKAVDIDGVLEAGRFFAEEGIEEQDRPVRKQITTSAAFLTPEPGFKLSIFVFGQ